jgi:hypothetical protein
MIGLVIAVVILMLPAAVAAAPGVGGNVTVAPQQRVVPPATVQPLRPVAPTPPATQRFQLNPSQAATLKSLGVGFARTGNADALAAGWQAFVGTARPGASDVEALVELVMKEAADQQAADLNAAMDRLKAITDRKRQMREEIKRMRDFESALARGLAQTPQRPSGIIPGAATIATAPQAAAYRGQLTAALATLDRDTQLANLDLQRVLERHQQSLQIVSSVQKKLSDTASSVIANIK